MTTAKVKTILERLFCKGGSKYKKLLSLETKEFYAFVINNEHLLKEEFREVTANMNQQISIILSPKNQHLEYLNRIFISIILVLKMKPII